MRIDNHDYAIEIFIKRTWQNVVVLSWIGGIQNNGDFIATIETLLFLGRVCVHLYAISIFTTENIYSSSILWSYLIRDASKRLYVLSVLTPFVSTIISFFFPSITICALTANSGREGERGSDGVIESETTKYGLVCAVWHTRGHTLHAVAAVRRPSYSSPTKTKRFNCHNS